jgi:hypothetical protein
VCPTRKKGLVTLSISQSTLTSCEVSGIRIGYSNSIQTKAHDHINVNQQDCEDKGLESDVRLTDVSDNDDIGASDRDKSEHKSDDPELAQPAPVLSWKLALEVCSQTKFNIILTMIMSLFT